MQLFFQMLKNISTKMVTNLHLDTYPFGLPNLLLVKSHFTWFWSRISYVSDSLSLEYRQFTFNFLSGHINH